MPVPTSSTRRWFLFGLPLVILVAMAGVIIGLQIIGDPPDASASSVRLTRDGEAIFTGNAAAAAATASREAHFEVRLPEQLPAGFKVTGILVEAGLADAPGVPTKATVTANNATPTTPATAAITIEETGTPFGAPTGRADPVDIGVPGVTAYVQKTDAATGYWVLTKDRGFLVSFTGDQSRVTQDEVMATLRSLVK